VFGKYGDKQGGEALARLNALLAEIPAGGLKSLRGSFRQADVAARLGVSQQHFSDLESGQRRITPALAERLGQALETDPNHLMAASSLMRLKAATKTAEPDPDELLQAMLEVDELIEEDSEFLQNLRQHVVEVVEGYVRAVKRGGAEVATKQQRRERDARGVVRDKPFAPSGRAADVGAPERDARGIRLNKPFDPRNWGR
jgi:plasmid maintenance system antidote protein VapI